MSAQPKTIEHEPSTAIVPRAPLTPMDMIARASESGASVETLEKLMALQERWQAQQAKQAFDEAMAAAKAEIPVIFKNRTVDFTSAKGRTNYRHEDMAGIARQVDPILAKHGLSYRYRTSSVPNEPVTVTCIVSHRMGHSEENTLSAGRDDTGNKNSIQQIGSTVTYLQRYTLKAALGLSASMDDDARADAADVGAGGVISNAEQTTLRDIITVSGVNEPKFLEYMTKLCKRQIATLGDIPANRYDEARTALENASTARARKRAAQ